MSRFNAVMCTLYCACGVGAWVMAIWIAQDSIQRGIFWPGGFLFCVVAAVLGTIGFAHAGALFIERDGR